jgi:hypothetical protein
MMPHNKYDTRTVLNLPSGLGLHRPRHHGHSELQSTGAVLLLTFLLIAVWAISVGS